MAARGLKLVQPQGEIIDPDTGEITEFACKSCQGKEHELTELQRKMRGMARELGELRRDKDLEAREHEAWPILLKLFDYWSELTGHTKAQWSSDRFWCALPLWKVKGTGNCAAAIAGIAYDPNTKPRKNGGQEIYDSWELVFKNMGALERYIRRRPRTWTLPEHLAALEKHDR